MFLQQFFGSKSRFTLITSFWLMNITNVTLQFGLHEAIFAETTAILVIHLDVLVNLCLDNNVFTDGTWLHVLFSVNTQFFLQKLKFTITALSLVFAFNVLLQTSFTENFLANCAGFFRCGCRGNYVGNVLEDIGQRFDF